MRRATLAAAALGFAFAFAPFSGSAAAASATVFEVSLDRAEVALGDRVTVTYTTRIPEGTRIEVEALVSPKVGEGEGSAPGPVFEFDTPGASGASSGAETKEKGPGGHDGLVPWKRSFSFLPLVAGDLPVPGPRLVLVSPTGERTPVRPPETRVKVASRLPEGQKPEELAPKADRPVRIPPLGPWFWGTMACLAALLAAAVFFLLRRKRRPVAAPSVAPVPSLPPGPEFLAALEALAARLPAEGDDPRSFYSELTRAAKRYLERHIHRPVLEWTTFETVRRLRELGWEMPREIAFPDLLGAADQVKFARGATTRSDAERHLSRARLLHDHVEGRLAAEAAVQAAAARRRAAAHGTAGKAERAS